MKHYDVAAYVWPSYTGKELRSRIFWEQGIGEWQSVISSEKRLECQILPRKPLWGTVDEADPKVMHQQINEAVRHGVNVFIYDWYWYDRRPFLEQCLDEGFLGADNNEKMRFYLMWANHDATHTWDKRQSGLNEIIWLGSQPREEFEIICNRVIEKYFSKPNYYRINDCPVFAIYDIVNLVKGLGGIDKTKSAIDYFRYLVKQSGFPDIHLQMIVWSEKAMTVGSVDTSHEGTTVNFTNLLGFDSVTHYQFVHFTDCNRNYLQVLEDVKTEWKRIRNTYSVPYFPHISIGWDNNPRYNYLTLPVMKNNSPEAFKQGLIMAKQYSDKYNINPLITINSWNEWTEMSYLEPDDINGYGYLNAVRDVFLG